MTFKEFKLIAQEGKDGKIKHGTFLNRLERFLSVRISWFLMKLLPGLRPNHVSFLNVVLIAFVLLWPAILGESAANTILVVQIVNLFICSILDKVDGEIARVKKHFSQSGVYYDLLFHFLYTFSFYSFVSIAFLQYAEGRLFLGLSILFAILATINKMLGKIRHHVKYKIQLENHGEMIRDPIIYRHPLTKVEKIIEYAFFMPYDWTFLLMIIVVGMHIIDSELMFKFYSVFVVSGLVYSIYRILFWYPKNALYSKEDLAKQ